MHIGVITGHTSRLLHKSIQSKKNTNKLRQGRNHEPYSGKCWVYRPLPQFVRQCILDDPIEASEAVRARSQLLISFDGYKTG